MANLCIDLWSPVVLRVLDLERQDVSLHQVGLLSQCTLPEQIVKLRYQKGDTRRMGRHENLLGRPLRRRRAIFMILACKRCFPITTMKRCMWQKGRLGTMFFDSGLLWNGINPIPVQYTYINKPRSMAALHTFLWMPYVQCGLVTSYTVILLPATHQEKLYYDIKNMTAYGKKDLM